MLCQLFRWMLIVVGIVLLLAAVLPFVVLLHIPEPYATEWVAAKLLMLPLGAICVFGGVALASRVQPR